MNHSKKLKKKRFEKKVKRLLYFYIFPLSFLFLAFIFLWNSEYFKIKNIETNLKNGEAFILKIDVRSILGQRYFDLFSKNNFLFYPKDEIENQILMAYPDFKSIKIEEKNKELFLTIEKEKGLANFCFKKKCFALNKNGKLFSENSEKDLIFASNFSKKEGEFLLGDKKRFSEILDFIKKLKVNFGFEIKRIFLKQDIYWKFTTKNNESFLFDWNFTPSQEISKIKKFSKSKDLKIENGKFKKNVIYLNLFLDDTAYICFKGDVCEKNYSD